MSRNVADLARHTTLAKAVWETITEPVYWFGQILPIGTEYKAFETKNAGWITLKESVAGHQIARL